MRRLMTLLGASLMVVGLSACGSNADEQSQKEVMAALKAQLATQSQTVTPTTTTEPDHREISDQLDQIEHKVDGLAPDTKTVTKDVGTVTVVQTKTKTVTVTPSSSSTVPPPPPPPPPGTQTLGVGGVATPPGAIAPTGTGKWSITAPGVYDCKGATVGFIEIKSDGVTVQNCVVVANNQYGIYSSGNGNTIQNNDIKGLKPTGDGDMNAITFFGNDTVIAWNTAIDFVATSGSDSHTDFVQTWVSSSHPTASSNVTIRSNKATGPDNPKRTTSVNSIHQCVIAEDKGRGGNSGGDSTGMKNWLIIANIFHDSWNQCIKNDGVDGFVVTKNDFQGTSDHVMEQAQGADLKFFSDNKIGTGYGNVGVPITAGAGPN